MNVAREQNIVAHRGVYVAMVGPTSRPARYRFLRAIGADVVGMSTVPEVLVAVHAGMKVLGFSIVTDMCLPDALHPCRSRRLSPWPTRPRPNCGASSDECWSNGGPD